MTTKINITDPTYLRSICDGLSAGSINKDNATALPTGLVGVYEEALPPASNVNERKKFLEFFAVWALLKKEVSSSFVAEVLGKPEKEILNYIYTYSAWFISLDSGKYQLYHKRLKLYLLQRLGKGEVSQLHEKLIIRLEQAIEEQKADELELYALEFLGNYKFTKAINEGEEADFIGFSLDEKNWQRQREISKDFSWAKKMVGESIVLNIRRNGDGLSKSVFSLLKIGCNEQNEYHVILSLIKNNEFELCRQRLDFFGGRSLLDGKRRFIITLKIIEEILNRPLEVVEKRKFVLIFLEFIDTEISAEKYLFNWNEFLPLSYVIETVVMLMKIDVNPLAILNKTNKLEFDYKCGPYINRYNLGQIFDLIENCNSNNIDKFASKINLCEFAIQLKINNKQIKYCLNKLLSKSALIQSNVGSKIYYRKLIRSFLMTESFNEILSFDFINSKDIEEILIEEISLHISKNQLIEIELLKSKINNLSLNTPINSLVDFVLNRNEVNLFKDESFKNLSNRYRLLFHIFISLKEENISKSEFYWTQLTLEIKNEIELENKSSIGNDLIYIFKILVSKDYNHEIQNLFHIFYDYLNEEITLKLITGIYRWDKDYFGKYLSEFILNKNSEGVFLDSIFWNSLISFCLGDFGNAISSIEKIDNILHKDFIFKLLLKETRNDKRLCDAYMKFNFFVPKVKTRDTKMHINALKFVEETKLKSEGKLTLFEIRKKIEQSWKNPLHFFQLSQNEYLQEIINLYIRNGNLLYAQKFNKIEIDPLTADLLLFESKKETILKNKSAFDFEFINEFQTKTYQWLARQFIAKFQYERDENIEEPLNTLSKITSTSHRIQGYFNCLEHSLITNDLHHQKLFELIELDFKNFGIGDAFQKGNDKFGRLNILTSNSFLLIKLQKDDFLIDQLKLYSYKDRFLAYLKIADKCRINEEKKIGKIFFRRVFNQMNKIVNISDEVEIRCEIIQLSSKFKFKSLLNDNIFYLRDIISNCNDDNLKSKYALRIIISCLKIQRFKWGYEFYSYLINHEDKLELVRLIGSQFKSTMRQTFLSELNYFIDTRIGLQEIAKSKIAKLKIDECSDMSLYYSYFVKDDNETLYKLLTNWFLNEIFFKNTPTEELDEYANVLNLQWAIDIKNSLSVN